MVNRRDTSSYSRNKRSASSDRDHADEKQFERTFRKMKNSVKSLLVAAAVTGLLGTVTLPAAAQSSTDQKTTTTDSKDKNSCTGKNGCSGKDAKAKKASKKDKTKTADTAKDKNSCKSANGCSGKDEKKN
jgi:hypothetical protein